MCPSHDTLLVPRHSAGPSDCPCGRFTASQFCWSWDSVPKSESAKAKEGNGEIVTGCAVFLRSPPPQQTASCCLMPHPRPLSRS